MEDPDCKAFTAQLMICTAFVTLNEVAMALLCRLTSVGQSWEQICRMPRGSFWQASNELNMRCDQAKVRVAICGCVCLCGAFSFSCADATPFLSMFTLSRLRATDTEMTMATASLGLPEMLSQTFQQGEGGFTPLVATHIKESFFQKRKKVGGTLFLDLSWS